MEVLVEAAEARVTIVIVARERFGLAARSLDSVLDDTRIPFELVYVDGGSPPTVQSQIEKRVHAAGGLLLRHEEFLSPNAARNLALPHVRTEYVAFVDNDVRVEAGWLDGLLACADETGAAIVGPLTMIETPKGSFIHLVGGEIRRHAHDGMQELSEHHVQDLERFKNGPEDPSPQECDFAEYHTMLVRRSVLDAVGPLDEGCLSVAEHLDLALLAKDAGHSVHVEPRSRVTYVQPHALTLGERAYFMKRWSDEGTSHSLDHFAEKWEVGRYWQGGICETTQSFVYEHQSLCPLPVSARVEEESLTDSKKRGVAQTPAQLYQQMRIAGWDTASIARIQATCDFAISLFSDLFRACGKPFLCHAIGTASVLLRYGAPLTLIKAALVHAAYSHGRFPAMKSQSKRRKIVSRNVGRGCESLVHRYQGVDWQAGPPSTDLDRLGCIDAGTYLLRMANDLEEQLDLSLAYTGKPIILPAAWPPFFRALAGELGVDGLALELERASEATRVAHIPEELRREGDGSYAIDWWSRAREKLGRRQKILAKGRRRRLLRRALFKR